MIRQAILQLTKEKRKQINIYSPFAREKKMLYVFFSVGHEWTDWLIRVERDNKSEIDLRILGKYTVRRPTAIHNDT